jgi:2-oxoglutarate dehydrogenase E1 component
MEAYPREIPVFWVQEEPENMGAWSYLNLKLKGNQLGRHSLSVVCRPAAASPATGWASAHKNEQADLLAQAAGESSMGSEARSAFEAKNSGASGG